MNEKLLDLQTQFLPLRNEIRRAIDEVCDQQALILGPHVERFERNLATYCNTKHAIGVSSGTAGLHLALRAPREAVGLAYEQHVAFAHEAQALVELLALVGDQLHRGARHMPVRRDQPHLAGTNRAL